MMIFNHPAFPSQFDGFWPLDASTIGDLGECVSARSARDRRFIKPNKTESPNRANQQIFIGRSGFSRCGIASENCRECCIGATTEKDSKMTALQVLGLVILAGFAVVMLLALLFDRARKAIDSLKWNSEFL